MNNVLIDSSLIKGFICTLAKSATNKKKRIGATQSSCFPSSWLLANHG